MFKKTPMQLTALLTCIALLTACGGDDDNEPSSGSSPTPDGTVTATPDGSATPELTSPVTLSVAEGAILTNPQNDRMENLGTFNNEPVQLGTLGDGQDYATWVIAEGDGVSYVAPLDTLALSLAYAGGADNASLQVVVDGEQVGEFTFDANMLGDWFTPITVAPRTVEVNLDSIIPAGSDVHITYDGVGFGASIGSLTFYDEPLDLSDIGMGATPQPQPIAAKFMPEEDKVLVFVGQDNLTVGGNGSYTNGYVDSFGTPAGITHYIAFDGQTNIDEEKVQGLNVETSWNAGPMHHEAYVTSPQMEGAIMHVSLYMVGIEEAIANGEYDDHLQIMADYMKTYSQFPFMLRFGYEFDNPDNDHIPETYIPAWRYMVDYFRAENVDNFNTIFHGLTMNTSLAVWNAYYPGDEYVDWIGFSYFGGPLDNTSSGYRFAHHTGKPVCICETTPRTFDMETDDGQLIWDTWLEPLLEHIEQNSDVIKAVSHINTDWPSQGLWVNVPFFNTTDARIQENARVSELWTAAMEDGIFVHTTDGTFELINFTPQ